MARLKRHGLRAASLLLIITSLAVAVAAPALSGLRFGAAHAQSAGPESIGPEAYLRVQALRRELGMSAVELAALGLTREQAAAALGRLVAWQASSGAALAAAEAGRGEAGAELSEAYRRFHTGADRSAASSIPTLERELATKEAAREAILQAARGHVEAALTTPQRSVWSTIRSNAGVESPHRYAPSLTADQRPSQSAPDRRTAALTTAQRSAVQAAEANVERNLTGVLAAEAEVLPVPAELVALLGPGAQPTADR